MMRCGRAVRLCENKPNRKNPVISAVSAQITSVFTVRCSISPRTWA
jgi:hypothetical protein